MKKIAIQAAAGVFKPQDGEAITKKVEAALAVFDAIFKKAGYTKKIQKASAMQDISYTERDPKGEKPKVFILSGWHGKGGYGKYMTLFSLYRDDIPYPKSKVVEMPSSTMPDEMTPSLQEDIISEMTAYIKANV